jgi:hypothetical protein
MSLVVDFGEDQPAVIAVKGCMVPGMEFQLSANGFFFSVITLHCGAISAFICV